MATRAAAHKPDGSRREVVGRVRVWKRALLRVNDTASTLASYQWVQTCTPSSCQHLQCYTSELHEARLTSVVPIRSRGGQECSRAGCEETEADSFQGRKCQAYSNKSSKRAHIARDVNHADLARSYTSGD